MSANEVLEQFRALPPEEQRLVAEQIWEAFEPDFETPEMLAELERRAEEAHRNPQDGVPWDQLRAELREKYRLEMNPGFRRQAKLELWEAIAWYEKQRPGLGAEFNQALNLLLQQIVRTPKRFRHLTPLVGKARLKRFPYFIYFTEATGEIQIIAIIHVRRGAEWIERRLAE